jgi:hypothetical protein
MTSEQILNVKLKMDTKKYIKLINHIKCLWARWLSRNSYWLWARRYGNRNPVGRDYSIPSRPSLGYTLSIEKWIPGFSRGKAAGGGADHPSRTSRTSAEAKNE